MWTRLGRQEFARPESHSDAILITGERPTSNPLDVFILPQFPPRRQRFSPCDIGSVCSSHHYGFRHGAENQSVRDRIKNAGVTVCMWYKSG